MELLEPPHALKVTLFKALDEIDENWRNYKGLICLGSQPGQDDSFFFKKTIPKILQAKKDGMPFLGLCLGLQALILAEGGKLRKIPEQRQGIYEVTGWWGKTHESHWHRFKGIGEFPEYEVYKNEGIIEVMRLKNHLFFVGTQFHPEYQSSKDKAHPILTEFIKACKQYTQDGRLV